MSKFIKPDNDDWMLGIKKVGNGYVIQTANGTDEGGHIHIAEEVVEEKDIEFGEHEATVGLLHKILEFYGPNYSGHSRKNVVIKLEGEDERRTISSVG